MSKCTTSIQRRDSNPQTFEHEWSPITTRQGLRYRFDLSVANKFQVNRSSRGGWNCVMRKGRK